MANKLLKTIRIVFATDSFGFDALRRVPELLLDRGGSADDMSGLFGTAFSITAPYMGQD